MLDVWMVGVTLRPQPPAARPQNSNTRCQCRPKNFQISLQYFCAANFVQYVCGSKEILSPLRGNSRPFLSSSSNRNRGLGIYSNRHEITKRDKKGAAGNCAAESTRFWCGSFMAGYIAAAVADVSLRPCTCRAAEQGFARTEAGSGGPSGRRQSFFYILIPAFFLGARGLRRMSACAVVPPAQGAFDFSISRPPLEAPLSRRPQSCLLS
jgi:hypothetical protein